MPGLLPRRPRVHPVLLALVGILILVPRGAVAASPETRASADSAMARLSSEVRTPNGDRKPDRTRGWIDSTAREGLEGNGTVRLSSEEYLAAIPKSSVSEDEAIEFIKDVWGLTDISDGVLRETLPVEYDGIPFKDWINGLIESQKVLDALANNNYGKAAEEAARIGIQTAINKAIETAGLSGVAAFASAAYWPIGKGISAFQNAAANKVELTRVGGRFFTFEPTEINHAKNTSAVPTEVQRPNH